jgi:hypothetical protein
MVRRLQQWLVPGMEHDKELLGNAVCYCACSGHQMHGKGINWPTRSLRTYLNTRHGKGCTAV